MYVEKQIRKAGIFMALMDEFKEERDSIKNGTFKQKFSYFWCYYKWHVICSVLAVVIVVSYIHAVVTRKDIAFYAVMLNGFELASAEDYSNEVSEFFELDTKEYTTMFDTSMLIDYTTHDQRTMASAQKLMVYMTTGDIDVVVSDTASMQHYSYTDSFADIRDVLTPEQVEKYQSRFYYIDKKVIDAKNSEDPDDAKYMFAYPEDPKDPSTMIDPIPVGIYVDDQADFTENFIFERNDLVLTVAATSQRFDMVREYIDYVFDN